jgi:hypothetical protein
MKTLITSYSFSAANNQIAFTGMTTIDLNKILLITNTTSNTIIYLFSNPSLGGTVSGNVLTLTYNTAAMNNTDKLQIYYDDPNASLLSLIGDIALSLRQLLQGITRPIWHDASKGSLVVTNPTAANLNMTMTFASSQTLPTVSTVTSLSQLAGFDVKQTTMYSIDRTEWHQCIRTHIT